MILTIRKLILICTILLFTTTKSYASAWTRGKNEALFILESTNSANKFEYIYNTPENGEKYFVKRETKLYGEYGLLKNLTVGGHFKLYAIKSDDNGFFDKITDDKFAEIFFITKLLSDKQNKKVFSFRTAYVKPISYIKGKSDRLNYAETREVLDLSFLFGLSNEEVIISPYYMSNGYFLNVEIGVRLLKNSFYDEFVFESTLGFKANQNSMMLLKYEFNYDYYQNTSFKKVGRVHSVKYGQVVGGLRKNNNYFLSDTHHKVSLSSVIYFDDSFFLELGIHKSFNAIINTEGFNVSLWFLL